MNVVSSRKLKEPSSDFRRDLSPGSRTASHGIEADGVWRTRKIKRGKVSKILRGVGRGNNTVAMQNFNRSYFGRFKSNGHGT